MPDVTPAGLTTYDAKDPDTAYPPIVPLRPPDGAPNVLVVLIDDVGFGASSAFGGPCATPNFERLAADGLKYRRFHTTALCSPTRSALLTGRNHHSVGMGNIAELATSAPGNNRCGPTPRRRLDDPLHGRGELGRAGPRPRQPQPPHQARGPCQSRDGDPVADAPGPPLPVTGRPS